MSTERGGRSKRLGVGLETVLIEGEVCVVGKAPRDLSVAELEGMGHRKTPMLKVIRGRCLDCTGGSEAEVRRCVAIDCVSWPYRMGSDPFRERAELSAEVLERKREALAKARSLRGKKGKV